MLLLERSKIDLCFVRDSSLSILLAMVRFINDISTMLWKVYSRSYNQLL